MPRRGLAPLALILGLASSGRAEVRSFAVLTNGRVFPVTSVASEGERVHLVLRSGGELVVKAEQLARVDQEGSPDPIAPAAAPAAAALVAAPAGNPYEDPMQEAAARNEIDAKLVYAVALQESGLDPGARSPKGAMGLMQLMPDTAADMGVKDPFDPVQSIEGGCRYLRKMLDRFDGNVTLALAAYNAGPEPVSAAGKVPNIAETKDYVKRVLDTYSRL
ncbi:MAG: lytic transglycosylase domain-containing protein [Acidobacteriota bacterium]